MSVKNRISVSFDDAEFEILERLSSHTQKSKAELIRTMVEEFLRNNPNRFRLKTGTSRETNILLDNGTDDN
ncbi:ribbon-helix-helix protein, CopG family [Rhizobium sp. BR 315]|uniref:ribbon-helix-helix protein, CopG family n=1 Tax=Rhizobium sp. BR 315 TaxID=3040014 RepID=UPI003D33F2D5